MTKLQKIKKEVAILYFRMIVKKISYRKATKRSMAMAKKTVIIGGVAGGATTAARLRRRDEDISETCQI